MSLNEFFMSFSLISKSFKTHSFWHITIPPSWIEGERENCSKYQTRVNQTTFLFPKMFFIVFKSIEIQNLKGFDILDQGRECDLNMKSDKKWSIFSGLNNRLPHMCQMLWLKTMHILRGSGKRLWKYLKETDQFTFNAWSDKES